MPSEDQPKQPNRQRESSGTKPGSKGRSRGPRSVVTIDVDAADLSKARRSGFDRFRNWAKTGGKGLAVSLLVHGIVLIILGLIAFQIQQRRDVDSLVLTWSEPGTSVQPTTAKSRRPVAATPVDVASVAGSVPAETNSPPNPGSEAAPGTVGVAPVGVGRALAGRNQRMRSGNLEQLGGSSDSERAIKAGLGWLARHQTGDGHWELHQGYPDAGRSYVKTDTGATALALLAFLGHGDTHQSGDYPQVVDKGLKWLREIQDPATGDLHDQRQEQGRNASFYAHSMATIALCEALAMTHDEQLRPTTELAVKYLIDSQHPDMGGWKYRPLTQRVMSGDISVSAWALMALHSARIAEITVPPEEFQRSSSFLDRVQEHGGSRYKYEPNEPESRVTVARTAIGLLCRQWLGWPRTHPPLVDGVKFLMENRNRPQWSAGRRNVFEWYYITQVVHNMGGDDWKLWNTAVLDAVVRNQVSAGSSKSGQDVRGSWSPRPEGEGEEYADKAGRLYLTAMCILILETPYRHRPIYDE
jgi:hypothetical protein